MENKILTLFIFLFCFMGLQFITGTSQRSSANKTISFPVGVVLDLETWVGQMANSCISMALLDFYAINSHYKTRLELHTRDSKKSIVGATFEALYLLNVVQVEALIGPQESIQAEFIVEVGGKTQVPIVSFTATNPSLSSSTPYFVRMVPNDRQQVKAIAAIIQAFGWKEVVPIYEDTVYGNGVITHLLDSFQEIDARISYGIPIHPSATKDQILKDLNKLIQNRNRVFIVHMTSELGPRFFLTVKGAGMMSEGYVWIITDGLANLLESMDDSVIDSMKGVLGVKPYVPLSRRLDNFEVKWKRKFRQDFPDTENVELSFYGLVAYDTIWALATAAEKVGATKFRFPKTKTSKTKTAHLSDLRISQHGPELLKAILGAKFIGLSGEVRLVDGQLEWLVFQILNVIGKGGREIGFWTSMHGITKELNVKRETTYKTSKDEFRTIIWPGEPKTIPRGWVVPKNGKEFRIGVVMKDGFTDFVKVERDPHTNATKVTGYFVEVFNLVMESLTYNLPYKFVPYGMADGETTASSDDLVYQIHKQKFDVVVGNVPITANQSSFVDFSFPYTSGGVLMVVQIKNVDNTWILFMPMSWQLWLACAVCYFLTILMVCFLEAWAELNDNRPYRQIAKIIWKAFLRGLRFLFGEGEQSFRRPSIWLLGILVLETLYISQAYFGTLPSVLAFQPRTIRDVNDVKENGLFAGYRKGSSVEGLLKQLNLHETKLRAYTSPEEYKEALMKGSRNGGIDAILDETPYINLFLRKYPGKFTVVSTYWTEGFTCLFPVGSPLLGDVSRAILSLKGGGKMAAIENKYFGRESTCPAPDSSNPNSPNQLSLKIFLVFFLFTSITKFTIFIANRKRRTDNTGTAVDGPVRSQETTEGPSKQDCTDVEENTPTDHSCHVENPPDEAEE